MMTLTLAAEQEDILQQQATAVGLSTEAYAAQVLGHYCDLLQSRPVEEQTRARRDEAVERLMRASASVDAPRLNLPPGVTLREYIHEGHRY
jgi:hypothetical protein